MSNQRSVMTEFRFLDQKRQAEGLTAEEASRYAQLRELVGPETAGPVRSGFDVNAAAAKLRESLLPAGLRGRQAEPPPPPEPPPAPAPAPEAVALEQAWAEAPFAELESEPADPLFDPGSLAQEVRPQAWNPEAPGYDPNAPYDEAAWIAAGYDPNATYDWSAYGYGPDGQPLPADAGAPAEPPLAEAAPETEPGWDAGAAAIEVAEAPAEEPAGWERSPAPLEVADVAPEAAPVEFEPAPPPFAEPPLEGVPVEAAPEPWGAPEVTPVEPPPADAVEQPWDGAVELGEPEPPLSGVEQDWGAPAAEPELLSLGEVEAEPAPEALAPAPVEEALPFDPNAPFDHAKWFGRSPAAPAVDAAPTPLEPSLEVDLGAEPTPQAFGEYDDLAAAPPPALGAVDLGALEAPAPAGLELEAPAALDLASPPPAEEAPLEGAPLEAAPAEGDPSSAWFGDAAPATHLPAPADAPFGDYDEAAAPLAGAPAADGALEGMLPFDPAAASAIEPGALPEGYEPGGPVLDPAALPPVDGAYDDAAGFAADQMYGGPEGDSLPGGAPLDLAAGVPDWQPEAALEQGFELASDGSFGHADLPPNARTPAWGTAVAAPTEGWESAPALDLAAPFEAPPAGEAPASGAPVEELPTIDGAELLEELPPEALAPAPELAAPDLAAPDVASPDFASPEPAGPIPSPLDGAFEAEAEVEAAAYPPPELSFAEAAAPLADEAVPAPEPVLADAPAGLDPFAAGEPAPPPDAGLVEADPFAAPVEPAGAVQDLPPVAEAHLEPEPAISYEPAPEGLPPEIAAAYATPAGGGDTFELPPAVADGLFDAVPEPEPLEAEPLPPPAPSVSVPGSHRVVLHTVDGQVKRGLLVDALLDAPELPLQAAGSGAVEQLPTAGIKAIFFMLAPGEKAPAPEGKKVRVTFRDGRQVAGFSPDYQDGLAGFFMIPADTRTNTGRIWVYQAAVKAVAVS